MRARLYSVMLLAWLTSGAHSCTSLNLNREEPGPGNPNLLPPRHETWCYKTLAQVDCYTAPQDTHPGRLIATDPPTKTPINADDYRVRAAPPPAQEEAAPIPLTPLAKP